jgi:hypothetical protein
LLVNYIYAAILAELGDGDMAGQQPAKVIAYDPEFPEAMSCSANWLTGSPSMLNIIPPSRTLNAIPRRFLPPRNGSRL